MGAYKRCTGPGKGKAPNQIPVHAVVQQHVHQPQLGVEGEDTHPQGANLW
jgi:hypothetical protein